jgi:hypothetical protein
MKNGKKSEAQEESAWTCYILMGIGADLWVIIWMRSRLYLFSFSKSYNVIELCLNYFVFKVSL